MLATAQLPKYAICSKYAVTQAYLHLWLGVHTIKTTYFLDRNAQRFAWPRQDCVCLTIMCGPVIRKCAIL